MQAALRNLAFLLSTVKPACACRPALMSGGAGRVLAVFPTSTKQTDTITAEVLGSICKAVPIPVVAIGGITAANAGTAPLLTRQRSGERGFDVIGR